MTKGLIAGLILAAGESSRMGKDKALLDYCGRSFLDGIVKSVREAGLQQIAVVLGHHATEIQAATNLKGVLVVVNQDYRRGQTSSLQAGLRVLEVTTPDAILLCLVDHPAVNPQIVRELCSGFRESGASVVVPVCKGRRGHPVIIGRSLFPALLNLKPDEGANEVIRKFRGETFPLQVDDAGVLLDIDSPEDYALL